DDDDVRLDGAGEQHRLHGLGRARRTRRRAARAGHQRVARRRHLPRHQVVRHRRHRRHGIDSGEHPRVVAARRARELRRRLPVVRLPRHLRAGAADRRTAAAPAGAAGRTHARRMKEIPSHPNFLRRKLGQEMRLSLVVLAALALVPLFVSSPYWLGVLIVSMYFAILSVGWDLLAGYTGQFSLAPAAFAMLGGYTTGLLAFHWNVPLAIGLPMSIVVPGLIGLVLGRIVLRLSGPYLALTTLSFAEIARLVVYNSI